MLLLFFLVVGCFGCRVLSLLWSPLRFLFGGCCRSGSWSFLRALCKHLLRTPVFVPARSAMACMHYLACFCGDFDRICTVAIASSTWADGFLHAVSVSSSSFFPLSLFCLRGACLFACLFVSLFVYVLDLCFFVFGSFPPLYFFSVCVFSRL